MPSPDRPHRKTPQISRCSCDFRSAPDGVRDTALDNDGPCSQCRAPTPTDIYAFAICALRARLDCSVQRSRRTHRARYRRPPGLDLPGSRRLLCGNRSRSPGTSFVTRTRTPGRPRRPGTLALACAQFARAGRTVGVTRRQSVCRERRRLVGTPIRRARRAGASRSAAPSPTARRRNALVSIRTHAEHACRTYSPVRDARHTSGQQDR